MKSVLLLLLRGYKYLISPMLGQNCRFYPSCSEYAAQAISEYGAVKGSLMAGKRLCKCHPWHEGGVDLVPPKDAPKQDSKEQNTSHTDKKVSNQLENSASVSNSGAVSTQLPSS
jgi:putative membrane protein insertion efficiency factor